MTEPVYALEPEPVPPPPPPPPWRRIDVVVLLLIVAVFGGIRFVGLGQPDEMIPLDEKHYVPDARDVLAFGTESDVRVSARSGAFVVHPPVGKILIAAGIRVLGDDPSGWRAAAATFGAGSLVVMFALARRLWRSTWWAALAALLLGVEGLWFVQSRIAMLDIFAAVFVLIGLWLALVDAARPSLLVRTGAAGALGLGLATKWSVLPLFVAVVAIWAVRTRTPRRAAVGIALFLIVPAMVYVGSYAPWFLDDSRYLPPRCVGAESVASGWWCYQSEMAAFHRDLTKYEPADDDGEIEAGHPYFSEAWSWPWIGRPVVHYYESDGEGDDKRSAEVIGLPNPAIWWPAFAVALPLLGWWTIRRDRLAGMLLALIGAGWLPYLLADLPAWAPDAIDFDRPVFLFYATTFVPFLVLAMVHTLYRTTERFGDATVLTWGYAAVCVATFAYFLPVLAGWEIPHVGPTGWTGRMWLSGDCTGEGAIRIFCWI